jgi:hypothetical protein
MFASVSGRGFDDHLAADFWTSRENLWDHRAPISHRWFKLFLAYSLSGIAQISIPVLCIGPLLLPFTKHGDWRWWLIAVAATIPFVVLGALLCATGAYLRVARKRKVLADSSALVEGRHASSKTLEGLFWFTFAVIPFFFMAWLIWSGRFPG